MNSKFTVEENQFLRFSLVSLYISIHLRFNFHKNARLATKLINEVASSILSNVNCIMFTVNFRLFVPHGIDGVVDNRKTVQDRY